MENIHVGVYVCWCLGICCVSWAQRPVIMRNANIFSTPRYAPLVTAVPFVHMATDPKAGAMGDAGIGSAADANATFWNIAKTPLLPKQISGALNYNPLYTTLELKDLFLLSFTGTYQLERQAVSFFGKYMNIGRIDLLDVNGESLQSVSPNEFYLGMGYAIRFSDNWSIGLNAKYIRSSLLPGITTSTNGSALKAGQAFALDVGVNFYQELYGGEGSFQWGLVFSNMGNKISYGSTFATDNRIITGSNFLPANFGTGAGYTRVFNKEHRIRASLDINKLLVPARPRNTLNTGEIQSYNAQSVISSWLNSFHDAPNGFLEELQEITLSMGGEYGYNDFMFFRTGLFLQSKNKGARSYYSMGLGLIYKMFQFNVAYFVPLNFSNGQNTSPLANTLRFGVTFDFDTDIFD